MDSVSLIALDEKLCVSVGDEVEYSGGRYTVSDVDQKNDLVTLASGESSSISVPIWTVTSVYRPKRCECGAKHDRHFPNAHMFYCPLYKKGG